MKTRSFIVLMLVFTLFTLSACVDGVGGGGDDSRYIKECLVGGAYCQLLQITDTETGCITMVTYESGFSGPSYTDIACPFEGGQ